MSIRMALMKNAMCVDDHKAEASPGTAESPPALAPSCCGDLTSYNNISIHFPTHEKVHKQR